MHARGGVPDEERLVGLLGVVAVEEVDNLSRDLLVHRLRAFQRQWAFVLARLVRRCAIGGLAPENRTRRRQASGCLWIHCAWNFGYARDRCVLARRRNTLLCRTLVDVGEANLLHSVQVIEIAPELLETVGCRQRVGMVAQVVLAELAG